jgi:hypothetical protein
MRSNGALPSEGRPGGAVRDYREAIDVVAELPSTAASDWRLT